MKELDKYELSGDTRSPDLEPPQDAVAGRGRWWIFVVVAIVALLTVAAGLFWSRRSEPLDAAEGADARPIASGVRSPGGLDAEQERQAEDLPALDASDELVRELARALSANPKLASWLVTDDIVRRFVVAVDNIGEGETPRAQLGFMAPPGSFRTSEQQGRTFIDPAGYRRYDVVAEVFSSLDTEGTVDLYRRLEPLIAQAYEDLGYPERRFDDALRRAARVVLDAPSVTGAIELEPAVRSFRFADERLENLDPVHKQLLRLGPQNLAKIQAKTKALLEVLEQREATGVD
ncbi:MAG: DUF3014 domain-containing protein [Acidobacteriota bacterium]|nr:DUF3014 domain-containing protein [Acidobacteriota bacterium]